MAVSVFVVSGQELVRRGVRDLTGESVDVRVVGGAATVDEARDGVTRFSPAVVVLDPELAPGSVGDGIELCRVLSGSGVPCVLLASGRDLLGAAIRCGAAGYVLKATPAPALLDAIRVVAAGQHWLDPSLASDMFRLLSPPPGDDPLAILSAQERRVMWLIAEGKTNRQIGDAMFLAEKTVKNYTLNLRRKLKMRRRTEVAAFAARLSERRRHEPGSLAWID